jgi:para-nitrobenzyl esterase
MAKKFICSTSEPIVQTAAGKLRGFYLDGTYIFRGVKYADAKRFLPPVPVQPWEGVRDALDYGYIAPLLDPPSPRGDMLIPHRFWPENEHCQYLNVWTRSLEPGAKKPVMVWLHGGGFSSGSSIEMVAYDGDNLCTYGDVVVVTLNHRLNMLGYFDLSDYGEKYKNAGNAGMEDIVAALKWVQENIAAFGGDPGNVTIFGQSGGGMKVTTLCQTPSAKGLFHKGIVMSGVAGFPMGGKRDNRVIVEGLLSELGLTAADIEKLETIPVPELFAAYRKAEQKLLKKGIFSMWGPVPGDWYAGDPLEVGLTENAKQIPLMVGTVIAEFAFGPGIPNKHKLPADARREMLAARFKEHTDALIEAFKKAYPGKNELDLLSIDTMFRQPTLDFAEKISAARETPVYSYLFALEFDYDDGKPAWHCADIPFVFHNTDKVPICQIEGVTERLEEQVSRAYINFARSGNPNHDKLPAWPAFKPEHKATMVFDRTCEVREDFEGALLSLLKAAAPPMGFPMTAPDNG